MGRLRHPANRVVASSLLTQGAIVVTGPLSVRLLGLEGRGEVAVVFAAVLLVSQVGPWGLPQAFTYFIARGTNDSPTLLRAYLPGYLRRTLLVSLAGAAGLVVVATTTSLLSRPVAQVAIMGAATAVTMIAVLVIAHLQGSGRFTALALVQLVPAFVYLLALIVLMLVQHASVITVLLVYFAGWLLLDLIGLFLLRRLPAPDAPPPVPAAELKAYGRRSWIGSAAPMDNLGIDQLLVGLLLGSQALGLFVVGLAFRVPIVLVLVAIAGVCAPQVAGLTTAADRQAYCRRWLAITFGLGAAAVVGLQVVLDLVLVPAFGAEAAAAETVTRLLAVAALFLGWRRVIGAMLHGLGHPGDATRSEVCGLVAMVVAMLVLTRSAGVEGAAVAMIAGGLVTCGVGLALLRRRLGSAAAHV